MVQDELNDMNMQDIDETESNLFNRENINLIVEQSLQREKLSRLKRIRDIVFVTANEGRTWCIFDNLKENGFFNEISYLINAGFDVIPFTGDSNTMQCSYVVYFGDNDKIEEFKQSFANENGVQMLPLNYM